MAENKIYITHDYQTGANVKGLKLDAESSLPSGVSGEVCYSGNRFYMHNGTEWDEVVTNESFGNSAHQVFDNKTFDGGQFST